VDGTNCADTKTGLDLNAAQKGLIDGVSGKRGLLDSLNPRFGAGTGCASNGTPATTVFGAVTINNDTLSCFFTNNSVTVGDVSSASYSGPAVISTNIYKSARFVWLPVLGVQPTNGSSLKYQVIDLRAGFVTDQAPSATRSTPATASNGVSGTNGSLAYVQVVFLNPNALPPPPDSVGALTTYQGGQRILRLVN
jgi:hypothetical protein